MKMILRVFLIAAIITAIGFWSCEGPMGPRGPVGQEIPELVTQIILEEGDMEFFLIRGDSAVLSAAAGTGNSGVQPTYPTLI